MARDPQHRERMPFLHLLPNLVTLSALCLGLTSIRYAIEGRFELATMLILLSAVLDGLDGLLARRLNATSELGAELDSLSDFLCFGVAPGILVYQVAFAPADGLGWLVVLVFAACTCLRLARFNVMQGEAPAGKPHFIGVPAPAGALLGLLPVFLSFSGAFDDLGAWRGAVALWMGFVGVLMISRLKTFSPKALRVPRGMVGLLMMLTVVATGLLFARLWLLLVVIDLIYLGTLMIALFRARGRLFA